MPPRAGLELWRWRGGTWAGFCRYRPETQEAAMGILEISMMLACASAIGFYIADRED
jgi:hypothetical protein